MGIVSFARYGGWFAQYQASDRYVTDTQVLGGLLLSALFTRVERVGADQRLFDRAYQHMFRGLAQRVEDVLDGLLQGEFEGLARPRVAKAKLLIQKTQSNRKVGTQLFDLPSITNENSQVVPVVSPAPLAVRESHENSHDKPEDSRELVTQPWVLLGISRATWYRRVRLHGGDPGAAFTHEQALQAQGYTKWRRKPQLVVGDATQPPYKDPQGEAER